MKNKYLHYLKGNSKEISACLVLALTLFFFAPLSVYTKNAKSLNFNLRDIWYFYLVITLIVFSLLIIVVLCVKRVFPLIAVIIVAFNVGFIIQGNYLSYNLGALDGHEILWKSFRSQSWAELIFWVFLIGISFIFRHFLYKKLSAILLFLMVSQLGYSIFTIIANPLPRINISSYYETSHEFEFSKSTNVIFIVLDTFRSEAFLQILDKHPEYQKIFKDFTYFQNALGGYPTTRPSIPLALTGQYYDNSELFSEYLEQTQDISIPAILKENGFIFFF